jgi:hypothetical protein
MARPAQRKAGTLHRRREQSASPIGGTEGENLKEKSDESAAAQARPAQSRPEGVQRGGRDQAAEITTVKKG